jgi:hypothetical protein
VTADGTLDRVNGSEEPFYRGQVTRAQMIANQNVTQDPRFLKDNAFQAPFQARSGVKFTF